MKLDSKKEAEKYFKKYFKAQYVKEHEAEFKSLVRLLDKAQKQEDNGELCTSFEHIAVKLKDGSTAVWTDGVALSSDNERFCQYRLQEGQKYKVVLYKVKE